MQRQLASTRYRVMSDNTPSTLLYSKAYAESIAKWLATERPGAVVAVRREN